MIIAGILVSGAVSAQTNVYSLNVTLYALGGLGFAFSPVTNITVTSLGYLPEFTGSTNEIAAGAVVRVNVWDANGAMMASADVSITNSIARNEGYYKAINPLPLYAGQTYYMQAGFPFGGISDMMFICNACNTNYALSSSLHYNGVANGTNAMGVFPANVFQTSLFLRGPTFEFDGNQAVIPVVTLSEPSKVTPAEFRFRLNGALHQRYVIQTTTNLKDWSASFTVTAPSGSFFVTATNSGGPRAYYRAMQVR